MTKICWGNRLRNLDAAIATLVTGRHHYLSTSCLHGDHGHCSGETGTAGAKTPRRCKFCPAPCSGRAHPVIGR